MRHLWQGRRIPLSWLLLSRQPVRLLVALAGISFAGILMFMQLGFRDGLFDASVTVHRLFDADLVLISPRSASSVRMAGFPRRRLVQTLADPAVEGVTPVHWGLMLWRNPETRLNRAILALGFNPDDPFFVDPSLSNKTEVCSSRRAGSCLISCRVPNSVPLPIGTGRVALLKPRSPATASGWRAS